MSDWAGALYTPIVRSRGAELKGLKELASDVLDCLLPVVEFTRSRRSQRNPGGALEVSVENVHEILGQRTYVADLTSLDSQTNGQVGDLLDPDHGFGNWVAFASRNFGPHVIPVAHLTDPFDVDNFKEQVDALLKVSGAIALRIPTSYAEVEAVLEIASRMLPGGFPVFIDAGFVRKESAKGAALATLIAARLAAQSGARLIAPASSSFPSRVGIPGYGGDDVGDFPLWEVDISEHVKASLADVRVKHGDYAAIHPLDFEGTVTAWVPRVDIPLDKSIFYHRYRRHDGGYVIAAQRALSDPRYVPLDCWAHKNIVEAADGRPLGRSPSHWIAVRLNYHVTRQVRRLSPVLLSPR